MPGPQYQQAGDESANQDDKAEKAELKVAVVVSLAEADVPEYKPTKYQAVETMQISACTLSSPVSNTITG